MDLEGSFFLQDATGGIEVELALPERVELNQELWVEGLPDYGALAVFVSDSRFRAVGSVNLVQPKPVDPSEAIRDAACHGALVRIEGRLLNKFVQPGEHLLVLQSGETILTAVLDGGDRSGELAWIRTGSMVTVDGICAVAYGADRSPQTMRILMRGAGDLKVLAGPSFWNAQRATLALVALLIAVAVVVGWAWSLRRKVKQHTGLIRTRLEHEETFSELGKELSEASSRREVGRVIVGAAKRILGWDSCYLDLYDKESGTLEEVVVFDIEDGEVQEIDASKFDREISDFKQGIVDEKGRLILRKQGLESSHGLRAFGDQERLSASLMFVPCRSRGKPVGILSIQSYAHDAYTEDDLKLLQSLADHCAGALTRVRAQEALRASEIRFRTVADGLGEGIMITDFDDVVLYVNSRMAEMTGYTVEEMIGQPGYRLIEAEEDWDVALERNQERADGKSERYELLMRRKDGSRFWTDVCATPFVASDGEIVGTLGCASDIDSRKPRGSRIPAVRAALFDDLPCQSGSAMPDFVGRWKIRRRQPRLFSRVGISPERSDRQVGAGPESVGEYAGACAVHRAGEAAWTGA